MCSVLCVFFRGPGRIVVLSDSRPHIQNLLPGRPGERKPPKASNPTLLFDYSIAATLSAQVGSEFALGGA